MFVMRIIFVKKIYFWVVGTLLPFVLLISYSVLKIIKMSKTDTNYKTLSPLILSVRERLK